MMRIRRAIALWICPELFTEDRSTTPRWIFDQSQLCRLIEMVAIGTGRSTGTISRLATGSGDTFKRLSLKKRTRSVPPQNHFKATARHYAVAVR